MAVTVQAISQRDLVSHIETGPHRERQGFPHRGWASQKVILPRTERQGLSQRSRASHTEARSLTQRPGLSHRGLASHKDAMNLKRRSLREGRPLRGRPEFSQKGHSSERGQVIPHTYNNFRMCVNQHIFAFASKNCIVLFFGLSTHFGIRMPFPGSRSFRQSVKYKWGTQVMYTKTKTIL